MTSTTDRTTPTTVEIAPGVAMPSVGFGTFQIPPTETAAAVTDALEAGYRLIDTATAYDNEAGVGEALAGAGLARDDVFVTTKLWNSDHASERVRPALERSLELLRLDAVDLYLIHWPAPGNDLYRQAWDELLALKDAGLARAVGVSNFTIEHVEAIVASSGVAPAVNQVEVHPLLTQDALLAHHREHGITATAWSPLAKAEALVLEPVVRVAAALNRTPAQVVLRWHLQRGTTVIPKSVSPDRMRSNLALHDFTLSEDDMAAISACDRDYRTGPHPDDFNG
jgi:2,5-diketo-D-gluconate reductase A